MRFLVVILVVWADLCWESHASLSIHSNNLVQMFSDYLASLEQRQMDIHNRKRDGRRMCPLRKIGIPVFWGYKLLQDILIESYISHYLSSNSQTKGLWSFLE